MAKKKPKVEETVEPIVETVEEKPQKAEPIIGRVANCEKLNVRKRPKKDAEVVCVITKNTKVEILTESAMFYKVCLSSGIQGFCMKEFIAKD